MNYEVIIMSYEVNTHFEKNKIETYILIKTRHFGAKLANFLPLTQKLDWRTPHIIFDDH